MDQQQIVIPDFVYSLMGRHVIIAEAQRLNDAATILALRSDVQRLQAPAEPPAHRNGRSRRAIPAAVAE